MPPIDAIDQLDSDIKVVKKGMREAGVPAKLQNAIATRALKTGRRLTGKYKTNRAPRWSVLADDPQYGTEEDCKRILLRLYSQLLCFRNAPVVDAPTKAVLKKYLGRNPKPGIYRDPLTLEMLDYSTAAKEAMKSKHGESGFHIGHEDPTLKPKHVSGNVNWRSHRSNLIQGDLTLAESRARFVELIARYFDLGEVTITPDS